MPSGKSDGILKLTINQIVKNYRTMSFVAKSLVRVDLII